MKNIVLPVLMTVVFLLCCITTSMAATTLSAGDLAIIGINSDGDDEFSFVLLKDITAGTSIYVTDKGWDDTTGFFSVSGDGIWQWSTGSDLGAGTIVHIKTTNNGIREEGSLAASIGTVVWVENEISTAVSYTGDQFLLYQGTEASPTFITGCHWNVELSSTSDNWDNVCDSNKRSELPDQLTNGVNAIWLYGPGPTEYDNFRYDGSTASGTPSVLRSAINNIGNWDVDLTNTTAYTLNPFPGSFTVDTGTPPTATAPSAPTVTEDDTDVALTDDVEVSDPENDAQTVTFSITGGTLTIGTSGITFGGNGNGSANFTASGTLTAINTALDAATFTPTADLSGINAGTIAFISNDGTADSNNASVSFDIIAVNDEPKLTATGSDPTFTEDGAAAGLFTSASASTSESGQTITGFTLTVSNVLDGALERLNADGASIVLANEAGGTTAINSLNYAVSVSGSTATVTFNGGSLSTAALQALINGMTYQNNSNTPDTSNRAATITSMTDSGGTANGGDDTVVLSITSTVTVVDHNDDPAITGLPTDITVVEDTAGNVDLSAATFSDVDASVNSITLTIVTGAGTLSANSGGSVTIGGSGSATLTLSGTAADIDTYLNTPANISYTGAADSSGDNATTLTLTANDGGHTGSGGGGDVSLGTVNVDIAATNDDPEIADLPTDITVIEDTAGNVDLSAATFSDVDAGVNSITLTIVAGAGTLSANSGGSVIIGGSGSATLTLSGTAADIDTYLNTPANISYTGAADSSGDNATTLILTANDGGNTGIGGGGDVSLGTVNVDITATNDDPAIADLPTDITVAEDTAGNVDLSAATFSDVDAGVNSITLTIVAGAGTLSANSGGSVIIGGSGSATLTLSGTAADIDTYLSTPSNILYTGAANTSGNDVTTLTLTANDGGHTGSGGGGDVSLGTVNVDITATNDDPEMADLPTDITVAEDTAGNVDLSAATFSDVDAGASSITLRIVVGAGTLLANSGGSVIIGGSGSATLTLSGTAADIDTYLNTPANITYTGAADSSGDNVTTLTLTANDGGNTGIGGGGDVSLGTVNVDITGTNDDPAIADLPTDITVAEDTAGNIDLSAATFSDVDAGASSITLTIVTDAGTLSANSGGAVTIAGSGTSTLTLSGTVADIDTFLNTASNIQYTSALNANGNGAATLTLTANDGGHTGSGGGGDVSLGTVNVDITATNDDPAITGLPTDITVVEDTAGNVDLSAATFSDVDAGANNITLTIASDAGTLSANSGGSVIIGGSGSTTLTLSGFAADIDAFLDTASNIQYTGALNADGDDAAILTLTANDGGHTGSGGGGDVSLGTVNVDITAVNDAPTLGNLNADAVSFSIGGSATLLDNGGDATVADPDSADFNGGNVTAAIVTNGQAGEDELGIENQGTGAGQIGVSGGSVTYGGALMGTYTGGSGGVDLVVTLNANASIAAAQALVRVLTYLDSDAGTVNTADRTVRITISDGDGGISVNQNVTVSLVRAPLLDLDTVASGNGASVAFSENSGAVAVTGTTSASDDGTFKSLTVTLTNRPDGASESLSSIYGTGAQTVNGEAVTIGSYNSVIGVLSITVDDGSAAAATLQMLMESIRYNNTSASPATNDRMITFTATDNDDNAGGSVTATVSMSTTNDAPSVAINTGLVLNEGATAGISNMELNEGDPDDSGSGLTYTVTTTVVYGMLFIDTDNNGVANNAVEILAAGETFTQADIDNGLLMYTHNGSDTIGDSFTFSLADGLEDGVLAVTGQEFIFTITPVNDVPVIAYLAGDALTYAMTSGAMILDREGDAFVFDPDSVNFSGGTMVVSILANKDATEDILALNTAGTVSLSAGMTVGSVVSVEGMATAEITSDGSGGNDLILSFNQGAGNASFASVGALLRAVTYENIDMVTATENVRTIRFTVSDGDGGMSADCDVSVTVARNIPPTAVNNAVSLDADSSHTFAAFEFRFSDPNPGDTLQKLRIIALPGTGSLRLSGDAVSPNQEIAVADITSKRLVFIPASDISESTYTNFTFKVSDGKAYSALAYTMTLNIIVPVPEDNSLNTGDTVSDGGTGVNDGDTIEDITVNEDGSVDNQGVINNLTNAGVVHGGTVGGDSENTGTLEGVTIPEDGVIENSSGAIADSENNGTIHGGTVGGDSENTGTLEGVTIPEDGVIENSSGAIADSENNGTIHGGTVGGDSENAGTLEGVTIPEDGVIENSSGVIADSENNGTIFGGTLAGDIANNGDVSGTAPDGSLDPDYAVTIAEGAVVTGGTLSGSIVNEGELVDVTITGGSSIIAAPGGIFRGTISYTDNTGATSAIHIPDGVTFPEAGDDDIEFTFELLRQYAEDHDWDVTTEEGVSVLQTRRLKAFGVGIQSVPSEEELPGLPEGYSLVDGLILSRTGSMAESPVAITLPCRDEYLPEGNTDADLSVLLYDPVDTAWKRIAFERTEDMRLVITTEILSAYAVAVRPEDEIEANILMEALIGQATESGGATAFAFSLTRQPTDDVTIALSVSDETEAAVFPAQVTFTSENYSVPQTVTVTGIDDGLVDGDVSLTVILSPAVSEDPDYDGMDPMDLLVVNMDDEIPVLVSPSASETGVSLTPILRMATFATTDPAFTHVVTQWQVGTDPAFGVENMVLDLIFGKEILALPSLVLEAGTRYYWRAKAYTAGGSVSPWAEVGEFSTVETDVDDVDNNGIPDDQKVSDTTDLDGNGTKDNTQTDIKSFFSAAGDVQLGVKVGTGHTILSVAAIDPDTVADAVNRPQTLEAGLIGFKIGVAEPGDTADVAVFLSKAAVDDTGWYKYDPVQGWADFTEYTTFSADLKSVVLHLTDGGAGDLDGVANGIIVDPSGPDVLAKDDTGDTGSGTGSDTDTGADTNVDSDTNGSSVGSSGCFLDLTASRGGMNPYFIYTALLALLVAMLLPICPGRKLFHKLPFRGNRMAK